MPNLSNDIDTKVLDPYGNQVKRPSCDERVEANKVDRIDRLGSHKIPVLVNFYFPSFRDNHKHLNTETQSPYQELNPTILLCETRQQSCPAQSTKPLPPPPTLAPKPARDSRVSSPRVTYVTSLLSTPPPFYTLALHPLPFPSHTHSLRTLSPYQQLTTPKGVGESIRGNINSAIDGFTGDSAAQAKNEAVAQGGQSEFQTGQFVKKGTMDKAL